MTWQVVAPKCVVLYKIHKKKLLTKYTIENVQSVIHLKKEKKRKADAIVNLSVLSSKIQKLNKK